MTVAILAVLSTVSALGVVAPAAADVPVIAAGVRTADAWAPPEDADKAEVPEQDVPDELWAPREASRFVDRPDDNARGVAPLGAPVGTVAGAPGLGELPWFSFQDFTLSPYSVAQVNIANGNLLVKENDFAIAGPGYALRHDRYYNGLSTMMGSLGGGWQSNNGTYDIGVQDTGTYVDYYGPNGVRFRFTRVGTTNNYTAPAGSNLTLVRDPASGTYRYNITNNRTGEKLRFAISGYLTSTTDRNDVGESYSYSSGNVISAYNSSGRGLAFEWGMDGFLNRVEDTAGRAVEYTYDTDAPRLKTVEAVDGKVTTYTYDSSGRLATITLPSAAAATTVVTFTYDTSHRVTKVAQQTGIETTFAYAAGQTVVTDSNGHTTTYVIDANGRVSSAKDALNRTRAQTWTANSDIATATDALGSNVTTYTYDGNANRQSAQLPTGAAASAIYAVGTGCTAPSTGTAFQAKCSTDDAGNKKTYQYDAAGNLLKQTDTTTGAGTVEFERTYGGCGGFAGQVCTTQDGKGNLTTYAYDADGDLTAAVPPAPLGDTTYTHDSLGRVTSVTDGNGHETEYQYDLRDRLVLTTFNNGQTITSTYHANGLEKTRSDSAGGTISFAYDRQGLLTQQSGPRSGITQAMTYDEVGNLLTYTDAGGTVTYTYDAANQLTKLKEPGGTCPATGNPAANSGCVLFTYNNNALETQRVLPGGATVVTARDNSGRPTRITAKAADATTVSDIGYSYAASGADRANVQSRTSFKEQGITAGAVTSYTYDTRGRLTLAQEKAGTTVSASWAYGFDNAGNRTTQTRAGATGAAAGTLTYGYNAANQLTSVTGQATTWTYDAAGQQTRNGLTGVTAAYGDRSQATQVGSTTNSYFGLGNVDRLAAGTTTFNSGALGMMQRTTPSAPEQYTRTPSGAPVGLKAGAARSYYVLDHLGSVVGIFSSAGTFSGGYSYSPYGEARFTSTNATVTANPLRYIGGLHEGNGIYKLGARYFDSTLGRFTQMDPTGQEPHPYAYTSGDPIGSADPSGQSQISIIIDLVIAGINGLADGKDLGEAISGSLSASEAQAMAWGAGGEALCYGGAALTGLLSVTSGAAAGITVGLVCFAIGNAITAVLE